MDALRRTLDAAPTVRGIEIKLSQGAKPGKGGVLPGHKVTEEIAAIRGVQAGQDCISPNSHTVRITGRSKSQDLVDGAAFIGDPENETYQIPPGNTVSKEGRDLSMLEFRESFTRTLKRKLGQQTDEEIQGQLAALMVAPQPAGAAA